MSLLDGRFRLGANFWARDSGPRMWSRFDADALTAELAQARGIGLDVLRVFAFIPDFVRGAPGAYTIEAVALARLRHFARLAERAGLALLPSALVGHMSGENFDLPGATPAGNLLGDPELRAGAALLVGAVAEALRDSPAVIGYALSNELPLWAGAHLGKRPAPADVATFVELIVARCRAAHPGVPIGLGDGLMADFPNRDVAARVDFVGPHVYHADPDPLRQGHRFDHAIALAARAGKPVLLEEFGGSSTQAGAAEQAALWSEAIFAAFTLGARGAIGWCWSDFPEGSVGCEVPYEHHGFELGFGITRADGSEKPLAATLRAWRGLLDSLPDAPAIATPSGVMLLRPSYLERDYPFSWQDRGACERAELTAYTIASQAGLAPTIRDEDALGDDALILVPSVQRLLTSTWRALYDRAHAGATVYWSWFGGDHAFHQGAWCPTFEALTGCRHRLRYGCFDLPADEIGLDGYNVTLPTGAAEVRRGASEGAPAAAFIPVEAVHASVLARDPLGRPLLVEHPIGAGRVIFSAAPLERYAARLIDGTERGLVRLYRLLGERAGLASELPDDAERLCVRRVTVGDRRLVAIMNRSWSEVTLPPAWAAARWSCSPMGSAAAGRLAPKQVLVLDDPRGDAA